MPKTKKRRKRGKQKKRKDLFWLLRGDAKSKLLSAKAPIILLNNTRKKNKENDTPKRGKGGVAVQVKTKELILNQ